jgi:hypothetical protein
MPWDRNPLMVRLSYEADGVAPHFLTERFLYTVPSRRKAILNSLAIAIIREVAPTTTGLVVARIVITPSGGSPLTILRIAHQLAAVGEPFHLTTDPNALMSPGDVLAAVTNDQSTGGTMGYNLSAILTEFDA